MCVDDQILSAYIDGELSEPWRTQIDEHLEWCEACKKRLEDLKKVHNVVSNAVLDDSSIGLSQNRVMRYLNANVLNKEKHTWLQKLHKIVSKKVLLPICSAALTFCFCLIIFTSPEKVNEIAPIENTPSLTIENITPVRLTDNYTTNETLDKYSLDDILRYLDESGYDVSIRVKSINPIETGEVIKSDYNPLPTLKFPVTGSSEFKLTNKSYFTFRGDL